MFHFRHGKRSRRLSMTVGLIALLFGMADAERLVFPTAYDERSPHTINIRVLANDLSYESSGELQLDVRPNGSMYAADRIYQAVRNGDVAMGEVLLASLADKNPLFLIDNIPFLVADMAEARQLWEASRADIESLLREDGLRLLYAMPWPPQGLYSDRRVTRIGDLAGLRLRSYSVMTDQLAELLGATTVPVDYAGLRSAFEAGRIDAMITSPSTGVRASAWEFTSVYTDIKAWIPKNIVFINEARFQALAEPHRTLLLAKAKEAESRGWGIARNEHFRSRITLSDNGVRVRSPSKPLQAQLASIGNEIVQQWLVRSGATGSEVLRQYKRLTEPD